MGGFQVKSAFWWQFNNKIDHNKCTPLKKNMKFCIFGKSQFHQIQPSYNPHVYTPSVSYNKDKTELDEAWPELDLVVGVAALLRLLDVGGPLGGPEVKVQEVRLSVARGCLLTSGHPSRRGRAGRAWPGCRGRPLRQCSCQRCQPTFAMFHSARRRPLLKPSPFSLLTVPISS